MALQTPVHVGILQKILTYVDIAAQLGRAIPEKHVSAISDLIDHLIEDLYPVLVPQQQQQQPPAPLPPVVIPPVPSAPAPAPVIEPAPAPAPTNEPTTNPATEIPHNNSGAD